MALNISNILEEITKMRHEIHTNDDMFNSESYSGEEQSKFIDEINAKLEELGLEKMDLPDITDIPTDIDVYELDADYDETYEEFLNLKDKINKNIEKWLKEFDKKYGTHYAPTGAWRYLQNNEGKWQEFLDKHSINKGTRNTIKEVKLPISEKEFNARKNIENNSDLQYNNTERESDINVNEQRRDLERDTSESRLFEKRKQQQLKENKYREWEKSITSKAENELTNEERKLIQGVKNNYNKDIIFIKSDNAKGYYAGTSLDNSRIIYINTEKANKFGLKRTALHETMESNIRFSDTATKDIIISTIDDIINDDTFINQKMEFWNNQDGQMPSDTAIAKDIICDRFAELQGEEIDYTNVLSDELKNRIDLAIEFFQKQSRSNENSTQSSFLVPQDNLQHENNINSTAKAQNYEKRQNSKFKRQMSEFLGVSRFTKNNKTILDNVITQLRNEYNSNGKISENTRNIIFKDMYNNLVKEDSNYYNEYKDLKNEIEGTEINISTQIKKDITN